MSVQFCVVQCDSVNFYSCNFLGLAVQTQRGYILHCRLHRNESHPIFKCVAVDCKQSFVKYEALKSHFCRRHSRNITVVLPDIVDTALSCSISLCGRQDVQGLVAHVEDQIMEGRAVNCPVRGCKSVFRNKSTFNSHMSKKHRDCSVNSISDSHRHAPSQVASAAIEQCPDDMDVTASLASQKKVQWTLCKILMICI